MQGLLCVMAEFLKKTGRFLLVWAIPGMSMLSIRWVTFLKGFRTSLSEEFQNFIQPWAMCSPIYANTIIPAGYDHGNCIEPYLLKWSGTQEICWMPASLWAFPSALSDVADENSVLHNCLRWEQKNLKTAWETCSANATGRHKCAVYFQSTGELHLSFSIHLFLIHSLSAELCLSSLWRGEKKDFMA